MAKWRPVDVRVWNDRKVLALSDRGKVLWLYLLTSPFMLPIPGVIVAGEMAIAEQLGWQPKGVGEGFGELLAKGLGVARFERLIWLRKALVYQPICGPNHIAAVAKCWDDVPHCAMKHDIWVELRNACKGWSKLFEKGVPEPLLNPIDNPIAEPIGDPIHTVSGSGSGSGTGSLRSPLSSPLGGLTTFANPPIASKRTTRAKPSDPTPTESASIATVLAKLSAASGVQLRGAQAHVRLILARLREGITELELRAVVAYCADEWRGDSKMAKYLRPETLFGPETIARYLDPARTLYRDRMAEAARDEGKSIPQTQHTLELVK